MISFDQFIERVKSFPDLATVATAHMPLQDCALCGTLRMHLAEMTDERSTSTVSIFCEKDGASFPFKRREDEHCRIFCRCVGPYRQATLCLSYSSAAAKPRINGVEWGGASQITKARAARGS